MEMQTERTYGVLVVTLHGRLDGFGAGKLDEAIKRELKDDDSTVVLDLDLVPYLSSAGIRVFLALKNELKRRKGTLALCNLGGYPLKVLESAGFLTVFERYPTVEAAVAASRKPGERISLIEEALTRPVVINGARYVFGPAVHGEAVLRVTGDLRDILYSRLTESKIQEKHFSDILYSLGLGGLGENVRSVLPVLGEMITLHGSMVWQPTDGNNTPDFFTPAKDTGLVTAYAGFNITLDGPFHDVIDMEAEAGEGITLAGLYGTLFRLARENRKSYRGVIAVAMWAVTAGVASSGLIRSPIQDHAPRAGESIFDPLVIADWISVDPGPRYSGDTMVSFGIGLDLTADLSRFDQTTLSGLYYIHPANQAQADMYLHNHGVIFRNIPWDRTLDLNQQIRKIIREGEFVDMRHLLDTTRIRKAKIGVAYISSVRKDTPA
jgi:anti-anti-sigma factor